MQHAAHLDVAQLRLLIVALNEVAALVALTEFGLHLEGLQADGFRCHRLQEHIGAPGLRALVLRLGCHVLALRLAIRFRPLRHDVHAAVAIADGPLVVLHSFQRPTVQPQQRQYLLDERRTPALAVALADDVQADTGTGERHV